MRPSGAAPAACWRSLRDRRSLRQKVRTESLRDGVHRYDPPEPHESSLYAGGLRRLVLFLAAARGSVLGWHDIRGLQALSVLTPLLDSEQEYLQKRAVEVLRFSLDRTSP